MDDDAMDIDPPPEGLGRVAAPTDQTSRSLAAVPTEPLTPVLKRMQKGTQPKSYRPLDRTANRPDPLPVSYSLPKERHVLPPTQRQVEETLLPPGMAIRGAAYLDLLPTNNAHAAIAPTETMRHTAANDLIQSIQQSKSRLNAAKAQAAMEEARLQTNYSRISSIEGGYLNKITPKVLATELKPEELEREFQDEAVRFFMDDPMSESDDEESLESDGEGTFRSPVDYAVLRRLYDVQGEAFIHRHDHQANASAAGHRNIPVVNKSHNDMMCYPLPSNHNYRECRKLNACICRTLAQQLGQPDIGYRGREYLDPDALVAWNARRAKGLPISEENDGPVGYCYHDWKARVNDRLHDGLKYKETPPEPIEPFVVRVGEGEYAADICWTPVDSTTNMNTGVSGRFPMYLTTCLQYTPKTAEGRSFIYLCEVNSDFQPRLSQANMCLGTYKSHPICNNKTGSRYVQASSIAVFTPRYTLEALAQWPAWTRFTRSLYMPVLADRQLLYPIETTAVDKSIPPACERVPVAWLRRNYLLRNPTLIEDRVRKLLPQALERRLCRIFSVSDLGLILKEWAALALSSFERSMAHYRAWLRDEVRCFQLHTLFKSVTDARYRTDGWEGIFDMFAGFNMPPAPQYGVESSMIIWSCALWRCAVATVLEVLLKSRDPEQATRESYQWRLFRGTHMRMFRHCYEHARYDDEWFLHTCPPSHPPKDPHRVYKLKPLPWLACVYPTSHAVLCAEELPNLGLTQGYTGHWFDMGNRKKQKMIVSAATQTFTIKPMGRSCLGRNASEMQGRTFDHFPICYELFLLITQVVMQGHLPIPLEPVSLLTLVRMEASFGAHVRPDSRARLDSFVTTMRVLPRFFLALFHYGYTLPTCPSLWNYHVTSRRSMGYVTILQETYAIWRHEVNRQVVSGTSKVDWSTIETPCKISSDIRIGSMGKMAMMHDRALQFYTKIKKGRFEEVLRRKLTAVEFELGDLRVEEHVAWFLKGDYMFWLLFVAWVCAKRSHSPYAPRHFHLTFAMKYFRALGLSRYGREWLRRHTVQYYAYEQHDDALKIYAVELYKHDSIDYHILKTFMVAYTHFRDQRTFLTSIRDKRLTLWALRMAMGIERNSVPPPLVGISHYCEGCRDCGNDISYPHNVMNMDLEVLARAVSNEKRTPWTPSLMAYGFNSRDADVIGFSKIYYNPVKCCLYCKRRRGQPIVGAMDIAPDLDGEGGGLNEEEQAEADRQSLFENMTGEAGTRMTQRALMNAFADFADPPPVRAPNPKANSRDRDMVTRRVLGQSLLNCNSPMQEVDLRGVYWKSYNSIHTRCVQCGRHCVAHSAHQTNLGMTCGKHINVEVYPDWHRIWWVWNVSRNEAERMLRPPTTPVRPCFLPSCRSVKDCHVLRTYDMQGKLFLVSVCLFHFNQLSNLIPTAIKGSRLPPVRIDHIWASAMGSTKKLYM